MIALSICNLTKPRGLHHADDVTTSIGNAAYGVSKAHYHCLTHTYAYYDC